MEDVGQNTSWLLNAALSVEATLHQNVLAYQSVHQKSEEVGVSKS